MKTFISSLFFITVFSLTISQASRVDPYAYPYTDSLYATMTNVITRSTEVEFTVEQVNIFPERNSVPLFEDRAYVNYAYALQTKKAPLIFVMPGLGGVATSDAAKYLAEKLYREGLHVVTLTNPFTWQFALAASTTGLVGYPPDDAKDLYVVMKEIYARLLENETIEVSSFGFTGYSLAGLQGAFLAKIDSEEKYFDFKKILLINSPFEFLKGIQTLDAFYETGRTLSDEEKESILMQIGTVIYQKQNETVDYNYFLGLDRLLPLNTQQLMWAFGASFRDTLGDVIFVSQQIEDRGILKNPATEDSIEARLDEIKGYSFEGYMKTFVVPFLPPRDHGQDLLKQADIRSLADYLKNDERIFFMHNMDDFLIYPHNIPEIEAIFGSRARIYPLGGHVGNLWYPTNDWDIKKVFSSLKN